MGVLSVGKALSERCAHESSRRMNADAGQVEAVGVLAADRRIVAVQPVGVPVTGVT
jgi:hypothetical protein